LALCYFIKYALYYLFICGNLLFLPTREKNTKKCRVN
jgi:hypothetical protein